MYHDNLHDIVIHIVKVISYQASNIVVLDILFIISLNKSGIILSKIGLTIHCLTSVSSFFDIGARIINNNIRNTSPQVFYNTDIISYFDILYYILTRFTFVFYLKWQYIFDILSI